MWNSGQSHRLPVAGASRDCAHRRPPCRCTAWKRRPEYERIVSKMACRPHGPARGELIVEEADLMSGFSRDSRKGNSIWRRTGSPWFPNRTHEEDASVPSQPRVNVYAPRRRQLCSDHHGNEVPGPAVLPLLPVVRLLRVNCNSDRRTDAQRDSAARRGAHDVWGHRYVRLCHEIDERDRMVESFERAVPRVTRYDQPRKRLEFGEPFSSHSWQAHPPHPLLRGLRGLLHQRTSPAPLRARPSEAQKRYNDRMSPSCDAGLGRGAQRVTAVILMYSAFILLAHVGGHPLRHCSETGFDKGFGTHEQRLLAQMPRRLLLDLSLDLALE